MEDTFNNVKEFFIREWDKTEEYQTQSWADAKIQLATNQKQISELFQKVAKEELPKENVSSLSTMDKKP